MAYGTKYILGGSNELNQFIEVFLDYNGFMGTPQNIISAVNGLIIRSVTADEDRFASVIGQECLINIFVGKAGGMDDSSLTIYDLIATQDNQIRATVYKQRDYTKHIFQGFVVVQDNSQPFLDPPFVLSIRALDGLGLLKGVDLLDQDGLPFVGAYTPIDWIANILYKTGQTMNIRGYFNIVNVSFLGYPPLKAFKINAYTFQTGEPQTTQDPTVDIAASAANDCSEVLEIICRNLRCRLFQQDGVWNLVNIWEYQNPEGFSYVEYSIDAPVDGICGTTPVVVKNNQRYDIQVGYNQMIHPCRDDAVISLKLATKSVKLNYSYDQSANKVCNQLFKFGDPEPSFDGTISSTIEDPTIDPPVTFTTKGYENYCWPGFAGTSVSGGTSPFPENAQTADIYIRDVLDDVSASENRYLVITDEAVANHVKSSSFLIDINDSLAVSVDFRTYSDMGTGIAISPLIILMDGDDGTKWGLGWNGFVTGAQWILLDANYNIPGQDNPPLNFHSYGSGESTMNWVTVTADRDINNALLHVPVSGTVHILLNGLQTGSGTESWFKNLQITIRPYLYGSFVQLQGDFNYSASTLDIKQTLSEDVEISDSQKRYFKGAILQTDGLSLMPPTWIRKGFSGVSKRFTQLMEQIMYNGLYRQFQKIEGTMRGLTWRDPELVIREAGYINCYFFTNHPVPTKKFMLTSFEKDYFTAQGRHVFVEILEDSNDTGQVEPDTYIFQYLFE